MSPHAPLRRLACATVAIAAVFGALIDLLFLQYTDPTCRGMQVLLVSCALLCVVTLSLGVYGAVVSRLRPWIPVSMLVCVVLWPLVVPVLGGTDALSTGGGLLDLHGCAYRED